ncbi:MAG: beta-1,6-glucan synthase [Methyloceanibacter sp.]
MHIVVYVESSAVPSNGMFRLALLFALVASAIGLFWYGMGWPVAVPASPLAQGQKLNCLSYAPFHGDRAPFDRPLRISEGQIERDLKQLAEVTSCVRTYSAARAQGKITQIADKLGLKVLQGIWINRDLAENRREIEAGLQLAREHPGVIEAFIVGNETLLRGELGPDRIKTYLEEVRQRSGLPVTYADVWEFWLRAPELAPAVDFVTIHILPYWEDEPVTAADAVQHVREVRKKVADSFAGKEIWIGEVGWPSEGRMRAGALPSPANQAMVLSGVVEAANAEDWKVNLIEAFDQPWKRLLEGTVGGYWGLFDDTSRELKFRWGEPVSNHPKWHIEAAFGIGVAFLVFLTAWLSRRKDDSEEQEGLGRDLAIAAIALGAGLVFGGAALGLPMEPPEPGDRWRSAGMIVLSLIVPMVAAGAVARDAPLGNLAVALNAPLRRHANAWSLMLAILFAATLVAAFHVALGLVFDPRYKDFQLAPLSGPVVALAVVALLNRRMRSATGVAEWAAACLLTGSALFVIFNEGIANWQALWFGGLLVVLALTALRTAPD